MSDELIFTNARVVTRHETFRGTVRVVGGQIDAVDRRPTGSRPALDVEGDYLIPGLLELHADMLEKHALPRPGVEWPAVAAVMACDAQLAGAGITTVLDSVTVGCLVDTNQRPRDPRLLTAAIRFAQEAGLLRSRHFLHIRCELSTELVVEDFKPFARDSLVRLVSLMDQRPEQRHFVSLERYREYNRGRHGLTGAQVDELIFRRVGDRGRYADGHGATIIALCQEHGLVFGSHADATVAQVEEAAVAGTTIAEFPTTLEVARAARALGLAIVADAPNVVRGRSHAGSPSVAELVAEGLLDILSSEYVPASGLHGAFLLSRRGLALPEAMATVTATPAEHVGLVDRGEIAPGKRADLVRFRAVVDMPVVVGVWREGQRVA